MTTLAKRTQIQLPFFIVGLGYAFYKKSGVLGYIGYGLLGSIVGISVAMIVYPNQDGLSDTNK
jgi:hypothetical protein